MNSNNIHFDAIVKKSSASAKEKSITDLILKGETSESIRKMNASAENRSILDKLSILEKERKIN